MLETHTNSTPAITAPSTWAAITTASSPVSTLGPAVPTNCR